MGKRSLGSKSLLLKLKLHFLGGISYRLAGLLGKVDDAYSATYVKINGHKRLNELMTEEAEYWKGKFRG
jgi:hypothetical protein